MLRYPDPKDVKKVVEETKPDVLVGSGDTLIFLVLMIKFVASMWTDEQGQQAIADAKSVYPNIKHLALPHGLQAEKGPEAVIAYINEHLPKVLDG